MKKTFAWFGEVLHKGGRPAEIDWRDCIRILGGWWPIRNVWSAAALQAKNENDIVGLRECIRPFCELLL